MTNAEKIMNDMLEAISMNLLAKIRDGTATHQDISNAIRLLHNNGIDVAVKKGSPLDMLSQDLPFLNEPSEEWKNKQQ